MSFGRGDHRKVTMLDSTFDLLMKAFRMKTKELERAEALKIGANLGRFFAVEMTYKGSSIRLIVCAHGIPSDLLPAAAAIGEDNAEKPKLLHQTELETAPASAAAARDREDRRSPARAASEF